jgi:hypothetical protein
VHDAEQGYDENGPGVGDDTTKNNGGNGLFDGGYGWSPVVDGKLPAYPWGFADASRMEYALSESPKSIAPVLSPAGLALLVSVLVGSSFWVARRRHRPRV